MIGTPLNGGLSNHAKRNSAIMTDEIPLDDALLQLREFIDENSGEFFVQVWGNGANFDNTILRRSYERQDPARGVTTTIAMYAQSLSWGKP